MEEILLTSECDSRICAIAFVVDKTVGETFKMVLTHENKNYELTK